MTYSIAKQAHPLDDIWSHAQELHSDCVLAFEKVKDHEDEAVYNAAGDARDRATHAIMALPARNLGDTLYKLTVSGFWDGEPRFSGRQLAVILDEGQELLEEALQLGRAETAA